MILIFYALVFIVSWFVLFWAGSSLVSALMRIAKFLGWREFVVAFFIMAVAGAFPNLFIGVNSALHKIPQLSFGDIVGGNVVDMTLAVAFAVLIGGIPLPAKSRMVQTSTIFTVFIAILPLLLIFDGVLGRIDGVLLLLTFVLYVSWLFSKKERFKKKYDEIPKEMVVGVKNFLKDTGKLIIFLILLLMASQGIVKSIQKISEFLNLSLAVLGILVVGVGNALPETYFAIASARKKDTWMILGDLMGSVIVCATLVLGIVALICPIEILDFSSFAIARIFLILSAFLFLLVVKTGQQITKKEAFFLFLIYILFLVCELFWK